jgi:hypothetical protein
MDFDLERISNNQKLLIVMKSLRLIIKQCVSSKYLYESL